MIGKESEIKVRLTPGGIAKLHRLIHLRPRSTEHNGNIYTFHCTEAQAGFYFFKFGKDAEIISPISLRDRFISLYENALAIYQTEDELLPDQEDSTVDTLDRS